MAIGTAPCLWWRSGDSLATDLGVDGCPELAVRGGRGRVSVWGRPIISRRFAGRTGTTLPKQIDGRTIRDRVQRFTRGRVQVLEQLAGFFKD